MFASLKPLFLRLFAGGWTGRDEDAIDWREGQGPRDLVTIDRAELEALRLKADRAVSNVEILRNQRNRWQSAAAENERATARAKQDADAAKDALHAITILPDTVRVTRAKKIAREALGE